MLVIQKIGEQITLPCANCSIKSAETCPNCRTTNPVDLIRMWLKTSVGVFSEKKIRSCEGTIRRNGGGTWFPEHLRTPHSFIRTMPQEIGKKFVPPLTSLLKNQAKNDVNMCGQKKNEKKAREEVEDIPKGTRKAPPAKFPTDNEGGDVRVQPKSTASKKESSCRWSSMLRESGKRHHLPQTHGKDLRRFGC